VNDNVRTAAEQCVLALNLRDDGAADHGAELERLRLSVLAVIRDLLARSRMGEEHCIGAASRNGYRTPWKQAARWIMREDRSPSWIDCLLTLFVGGEVPSDEMMSLAGQVEDAISHNHIVLHVVEDTVARGNIDLAAEYCERLRPTHIFKRKDNRYKGYRAILRYHAARGDADGFFGIWPKCSASVDRHEIAEARRMLVLAVSRTKGVEAALDLCRARQLGDGCLWFALEPLMEGGEYEKLGAILETDSRFQGKDGLPSLVGAYVVRARRGDAPPTFEELFDRVSTIDWHVKDGIVRRRDRLFGELGDVAPSAEWRRRCKKSVISPRTRKEYFCGDYPRRVPVER